MQRNIRFRTMNGYKLPDYIHMICEDCATRKSGTLRPNSYPMKTLCDMCENQKHDVYTVSSFDWSEYEAGFGNLYLT